AIKALQTDSSGSCAIIETTGNHYVTLDSILLIGTAKLHKSFLTGYLGFKRKGAYSEAKVQNVSSAFSHLPFLTLTQSPAVAFSEDKAALYIYANKQKINKFDAFIGIVPSDNTTSKVLITGSLLLDLHNICTIGENIRLNWQSIQRASQTLDIFTSFPCLFYSSFGVDGAFLLDKRDSSALDLNATAAVRYYLQKTNYLRGFYEYKHSRLLSTDYQDVISLSVEDRDFDANIYGLEFFMQNLDNIFNPRKGYVFSVSASLGKRQIRKNLHLPDSLYNSLALSAIQSCVKAGVSFYFPIKQRWVWYLGSKMGYLYSPQLLHNELFRIGGFATLRGFDEQSIYANLYLTLTNEIRFLFLRDSYLQLFFDAGWFEQRLSSTYVSGFPFGFGAGISFSTKAGAFAFSYALGKHPQNPFKIGSGRLTFGYVAVF
ncbi:MAG: BamA/TamA family outer membrane protein, partial [Bacteroidales bacterium]|nr:BamA/TamA family outer membrane protein [Bacteroidales bacterium]